MDWRGGPEGFILSFLSIPPGKRLVPLQDRCPMRRASSGPRVVHLGLGRPSLERQASASPRSPSCPSSRPTRFATISPRGDCRRPRASKPTRAEKGLGRGSPGRFRATYSSRPFRSGPPRLLPAPRVFCLDSLWEATRRRRRGCPTLECRGPQDARTSPWWALPAPLNPFGSRDGSRWGRKGAREVTVPGGA